MTPSEAPSRPGLDDPRVSLAVEEYLAALDAGRKPDRREFLARHADIAAAVEKCLDGLDFIRSAAPQLHSPGQQPSSPEAELQPEGPLGDFRIVREVGRGGMGVVYEAVQISMGRRVALKVLPFAAVMDPRHLQRFKNEARAAGSLQHPHIVPVYFVGSERGVHYFAMQFIEGQTLAALIQQLRQSAVPEEKTTAHPQADGAGEPAAATEPAARQSTQAASVSPKSRDYFRRVAEWGEQAAEALDHAHHTGIVHRDVKPGNLMIDGRGHLWVTDFGLAHVQQGEASLTMTGDLVGTLRYMSPEQALAKRALIDHRTDVYSLGVTLYELLTLEPVFGGNDRQELLRQIAFEEPQAPRRRNRAIPAELETIVLKALEKNPADRYATAKELADDLRRVLEDKPIRARRPSWRQVALKWARRHRPVVWSAAVTVVLTLAVLGGSVGWVLRDRASRQAKAELPVTIATEEAERLLGQKKVRAALSAAERAEELLAQIGGHPELSPRVEQLVKDLRMRVTLEEIRLTQTAVKDGHFDLAAADPAYASAFRDYGIDVNVLPTTEAVARVRASRIGADLVASVDDWAFARMQARSKDKETWRGLLAVSRAADPDVWRNRLRDVLGGRRDEMLTEFSRFEKTDFSSIPSSTLNLVVIAVRAHQSDLVRVVPLLRHAQRLRPDDFWVNHDLGFALQYIKPPRVDEAVGFYRAAVALCPESPGARVNLGTALQANNQLDEAIAEYREALRLKKSYSGAHNNLGVALAGKGQLDEAIAEYREALRLKPDNAKAHNNLGVALARKGRIDDAITEYREALRLNPNLPEVHNHLGINLQKKGRLKEAIAEYHAALRIKSDFPEARVTLGTTFLEKGQLVEAIAEYRRVLRIKNDYPTAHNHLGIAYQKQGRLDEAIAEYREALRLKHDDYPEAHNNLGIALTVTGRIEDAVAEFRAALRYKPDLLTAQLNLGNALREAGRFHEADHAYRKAIELKPDFAEAHCKLGLLLRGQGQFAEALTLLRRGHELGAKQPGWRSPSAEWIRQAERMVALEKHLPAILKGEAQPDSAADHLTLARMCFDREWHAAATRLSADAFAADPKLAGDLKAQHRYNAACAAALAGTGRGKDDPPPGCAAKEKLRRQALEWLRADLTAYGRILEKGPDKAAPQVRQRMQHWQKDKVFAGVRGPEALAKLPKAEGWAWQQLWADVRETLARANPAAPAAGKGPNGP